jgi:hypothetical protein
LSLLGPNQRNQSYLLKLVCSLSLATNRLQSSRGNTIHWMKDQQIPAYQSIQVKHMNHDTLTTWLQTLFPAVCA